MADNANTQDTQDTQDGFDTLAATLAGFGFTLEARTRLTFGTKVAQALAGIEAGGFVVVATKGIVAADLAKLTQAVTAAGSKAAIVDASDTDYSKVRPHVATFLRSRKVAHVVTPPRKDTDGNAISFLVRKPVA